MAVHSYLRGHPVTVRGPGWTYDDTGEAVGDGSRPCARCGKPPTPEGHDTCLGALPGVKAACCGHGVEPGYMLPDD